MANQITKHYDLGQMVDTGTIEVIHRTVVSALEKDLYSTHVGRFKVQDACGKFSVGNFTERRRVLIIPDAIERYELHLKLQDEEVPGAANGVDNVGIIYDVTVADKIRKLGFEVSFHYPRKEGDKCGALDLFGFDMINRKMDYNKPERGTINWKTLKWIYDQLRA